MNSSPYAIASRHGYKKTLPQRRFRRRVGICCPLPGTRPRGRPSARARPARGPQRAEVDREDRVCLALHAPRPASVGGRLPANAAVAQSGRVRGDGPRSLRVLLRLSKGRASEPSAAILDSRTLRSTPESGPRGGYPTDTRASRAPRCMPRGGHFGRPARPARKSGQRGRAQAGGEKLAEEIQQATPENVEIAYVEQGYTGQRASELAAAHRASGSKWSS